ncbi:hypothetical protein BDV41DRAFT_136703 [Aspergillus transmontanensis]|uniref:Secreted protein n=1 Tax=Aspergillus transmontanensis TaxID=1034304 RepID=A0A5N6W5T4_9EURO|nr:hypothetical protein BDV41DRAFT_136703 [Aspergillus transmontanensis]
MRTAQSVSAWRRCNAKTGWCIIMMWISVAASKSHSVNRNRPIIMPSRNVFSSNLLDVRTPALYQWTGSVCPLPTRAVPSRSPGTGWAAILEKPPCVRIWTQHLLTGTASLRRSPVARMVGSQLMAPVSLNISRSVGQNPRAKEISVWSISTPNARRASSTVITVCWITYLGVSPNRRVRQMENVSQSTTRLAVATLSSGEGNASVRRRSPALMDSAWRTESVFLQRYPNVPRNRSARKTTASRATLSARIVSSRREIVSRIKSLIVVRARSSRIGSVSPSWNPFATIPRSMTRLSDFV